MPHICIPIRLKIIHRKQTKVKYDKYKVIHKMNAMDNLEAGGSYSSRCDEVGSQGHGENL